MKKASELFIENLKLLMALRGLKQIPLAEKTGISQGSLSGYMVGRNTPTLESIDAISKGLEVTPATLLFTETERQALPAPSDELLKALRSTEEEARALRMTMAKMRHGIPLEPVERYTVEWYQEQFIKACDDERNVETVLCLSLLMAGGDESLLERLKELGVQQSAIAALLDGVAGTKKA